MRTFIDRLFWWWGFWRRRPRVYVHNTDLKAANAYAQRVRLTLARLMRNAPYRREHHRDLLTGMVASLQTGLVMRRPSTRRPSTRPGPHLRKRTRGTVGKLVGRPSVYEHRIESKDLKQPVRITRVGETEWRA